MDLSKGKPGRPGYKDEIQDTYGVPAEIGMRVLIDGKPAEIVGFSGGRLKVVYEGKTYKGNRWFDYAHPVWEVEYPDPNPPASPSRCTFRWQDVSHHRCARAAGHPLADKCLCDCTVEYYEVII